MQGIAWYKTDWVEAFYPVLGEERPDFDNSFGTLDRGYLVDVLGWMIDPGDNEWVKIIRYNDEGLPAILWVPMTDFVSGRKQGVWFEHCINLLNPGPAPESPFSGLPAAGKVMVLIQSGLYKDSALTDKLRDAMPGEVFWFDSETDGVVRTWYSAGGGKYKALYFRRAGLLAEGFSAPFPNLMLVASSGETQEELWAAVPEVKPQDPPPPPDEEPTLWEKILAFLKSVWEWLKQLFGG